MVNNFYNTRYPQSQLSNYHRLPPTPSYFNQCTSQVRAKPADTGSSLYKEKFAKNPALPKLYRENLWNLYQKKTAFDYVYDGKNPTWLPENTTTHVYTGCKAPSYFNLNTPGLQQKTSSPFLKEKSVYCRVPNYYPTSADRPGQLQPSNVASALSWIETRDHFLSLLQDSKAALSLLNNSPERESIRSAWIKNITAIKEDMQNTLTEIRTSLSNLNRYSCDRESKNKLIQELVAYMKEFDSVNNQFYLALNKKAPAPPTLFLPPIPLQKVLTALPKASPQPLNLGASMPLAAKPPVTPYIPISSSGSLAPNKNPISRSGTSTMASSNPPPPSPKFMQTCASKKRLTAKTLVCGG